MYSLEITRSDGSGSRREEIYAQAFTVVLSGSKDVEEKVVNNPDE